MQEWWGDKRKEETLTISRPRNLGLGRAKTNQVPRSRGVNGSRPVMASAARTSAHRRWAAVGGGGRVQGQVFDTGVAGTEAVLMILLRLLLWWWWLLLLLLMMVRRVLVVLVELLRLLLMVRVGGDARGSPFPRHGPACRRRCWLLLRWC